MPNRNPKGQQFERKDPSSAAMPPGCQSGLGGVNCRCRDCESVRDIATRLRKADIALRHCHQHDLVCRVVEMIVIEDVLPASLEFGDRSTALNALRRGLLGLHRALCEDR